MYMVQLDAKFFAEEAIGAEVDMARVMKRIAIEQFRERFLLDRQEVERLSQEFRWRTEQFVCLPATAFLVHNWPTLLRNHGVNVTDQRDIEKHVTDMCRLVRHLCRRFFPLTQSCTSHAREVIDSNTSDDSFFEFTQDKICIGIIQDAVLGQMREKGICEYSRLFVPDYLRNRSVDTAIEECLWETTDLLLPHVCRGLFTETSPQPSDLRHFQVVPMGYPS